MCLRGFGVLLLAGLSLTAQASPQTPLGSAEKGVNLYSLEKEAGLGKQLAAGFRRRTTQIDKPIVQEYLDRLGQKLAAQMPEARFPFTFSAIADDVCRATHEPAALPGDYVFVPTSLFLAAQDEAEFAGMLAHAMEHIAQRHGTREAARETSREATRGSMINNSSIPVIFMGGFSGNCSEGQSIPLGFITSQKSNELEADSLAVRTMARAGFDPSALARYIQRVQVRPAGTTSNAYSPLPDRDQRLAAMLSTIEKLPPVNYAAAPPDEFAAAQQEVRRLSEPPVRARTPPSLMRKRLE
jgi:beta-barrel assembly-enhancing protease